MSGNPNKGNGFGIAFLKANAAYDGDNCLIWPLNRDPRGYGMLGWLGRSRYAHRLMCAMAKGEPPTPQHQAAHSCGNGHLGCVNPRHLSWKTNTQNQADRREHGTAKWRNNRKRYMLTPEQVLEIRSLKGKKTQYEMATMFNTSQQNIGDILRGRSWTTDLSFKIGARLAKATEPRP